MIIRSGPAAALIGVSQTTLWRMAQADRRVRNCMFRRGWWIVDRLAELGLCPMPPANGTPTNPFNRPSRKAGAA